MAGTDPPNLSNKGIYSITIGIPSTLKEQQAIATALSDVDALISSLDGLIAKKKAIKQGAMQQLLTPPSKGGKRLPGFDGEWEEKMVGELCNNISSGTSNTNSVSGAFPLYGSTGQIGTKNYMDYEGERILVARVGANAGTLYKVCGQYCVSDNTLMISLSKSLNLGFLYYSLKQFNLSRLIFGSGQSLITGRQLKNLKFFIPQIEEQKAIAQILSDMDAELGQLEAKKTKYQ
ncbi:restriction endonuclease subunit S [Gillisia sp. Hel_I_29]|uniref:restriction endonuclease subunit S n=1 Tax=Gillisia sp. Hel_I_29 TaxID=1249975 RepID=UPI00068A98F8|nr:restriction endonuclease subunit S [Gillisia sp. Hel_I_29]